MKSASTLRGASAAAVALLALIAANAHADTPRYACNRLEDLNGRGLPFASTVNEKNAVAGSSALENWTSPRAVVWRHKRPTELPGLGSFDTWAYGVNDKGLLVGSSKDDTGFAQPVVWQAESPVRLPLLAGATQGGVAFRVNAKGQIIGWSSRADGTLHAALWRKGKIVDLGALSNDEGVQSFAFGLNDMNLIVGKSRTFPSRATTQAVRWDAVTKQITALDSLVALGDAAARAINNAGTIVGYSNYAGGLSYEYHAVAWTDTGIVDLGTLPNGTSAEALAINSLGVIVGDSKADSVNDYRATAWYDLSMPPTDLNTVLTSKGCVDTSGQIYVLRSATDVNDGGVIVATGIHERPDGTTKTGAFLLVPR